ncbi:cytochrome P450 4C1-like [Planococcus citri]|uniref:cytochrome P450 4C1-like n=1 Tax=Planococcus citri TaxID=170843 RepID=UPI0031F93DF4
MNYLIIILFSVFLSLLAVLITIKEKRRKKKYKDFPSYPTYPLIGNLSLLSFSLNGFLRKMAKVILPYRRLLFWVCHEPVMFLWKHDDIITVSNQCNNRDLHHFVDEWIGFGIISAKPEDEWKKSRKVLNPAFTSEMTARYVEVFKKRSLAIVDWIKPAADSGKIIDIFQLAMKNNIYIIVENTTGVAMQNMGDKGKEYGDVMEEATFAILERIITPWLHPRFMYNAYLKLTGKIKTVNKFHDLPAKILKSRLNEYRNKSGSSFEDADSKTIIDLVIKGGVHESGFTETRMKDELLHIIIAAIETTSLTISSILLMLAIHQDVQQKVYEEVAEVFRGGNTLTPDHLMEGLKYLEQVVHETIRRYSPVSFTTRRLRKDTTLKDNTVIPSGTQVVYCLHFANNDPELYENPQIWDPERFSEEAVQKRPKGSFMAFGSGPRSCIGIKYSLQSIKTQLTYILYNYHVSTNVTELREDQLEMDLNIRSKIGYPIKFTRRQP